MPGYFLDTSALSKHYHAEVGTANVDALFTQVGQTHGAQLYISRLAVVEYRSALAKKVRSKLLTEAAYQHLCSLFEADIARNIIGVGRIRESHFQIASAMIEKYALTQNLRTLDAIQLAVALGGHRQGVVNHFVCADKALCSIAQAEGLAVINPVP